MFRFIWILTLLSINYNLTFASTSNSLVELEKSLKDLMEQIASENDFSKKNDLNNDFFSLFFDALNTEDSFDYPFESLKNIGNLRSPNRRLRVFTWNIPQPGGLQRYFGFVMVSDGTDVSIFPLTDNRRSYETPQLETAGPEKWFGALYYQIREVIHQGETLYTLLGVDMNNLFSTKRIIEVVRIADDGKPIFGHPVFKIRNHTINRIVFEYSARANMVLRWEDSLGMIVFDHLSPLRPDQVENFQFYVPDLSFDGFKFEDSYWIYTPDVDIRNPDRDRPSAPARPPTENVEPGFLYRSGRDSRR